MNLNTNITIHRRLYGKLKLTLGLIKLRGWKDEPFWKEWVDEEERKNKKYFFCLSEGTKQCTPDAVFSDEFLAG